MGFLTVIKYFCPHDVLMPSKHCAIGLSDRYEESRGEIKALF